ncbi:MAG: hypothetical protein KC457_37705, partial [Myxococcales bacterium]|nr:hypothetical protein [Myxococcales bacterium]
RTEIDSLRDALELHAAYDQRLSGQVEEREGRHEGLGEQLEIERFTRDEIQKEDSPLTRVRRFDRRVLNPNLPLRERETMLRAIAEVWFLERAIAGADDPDQHVVFLELCRVGDPGINASARGRFANRDGGLFEILALAYIQEGRGDVEAWAALRGSQAQDDRSASQR